MKTKSYVIFAIVLAVLVIVGFLTYNLIVGFLTYNYLKHRGEFTYEGRLNTFKFTTAYIGNLKIYSPELILHDENENNYTFIYHFRNKPDDLKEVYLESDLANKFEGIPSMGAVYITSNPKLSEQVNHSVSIAIAPMITILGKSNAGLYRLDIRRAYTEYNKEELDVKTVTCSDLDNSLFYSFFRVIELRLGDENKIFSEGKCLIIQGKDEDGLIKSSEKFAYYLIGLF